jgi:opacity protein-like surface antigen
LKKGCVSHFVVKNILKETLRMTKFMKHSLALSVLALTASSAQANMPTFNVGIGAGYNSSKVGIKKNYTLDNPTLAIGNTPKVAVEGPLGQIHLGANRLTNNGWLFGLQLSGSWAKIDGRDKAAAVEDYSLLYVPYSHRTSLKMKNAVQLDVRLGKKIGDFIPHLILGTSFAQWKASSVLVGQLPPPPVALKFSAPRSKRCAGLVLGAGVDYNLTERFFIRGEYQYTWYKKFTVKQNQNNQSQFNVEVKPRTNIAMLSVGWRFG